ncbi:hypothetical protein QAD02_009984 [Eretmocerus hayati]|uniref:Uncharacterized protein n=1 Tax=Eretmocerus hayati TaxID=131215 RepID=A0ACC2NC78_9HYME|nr:hypothetical protein QAD02_009984 [Eretmocerus hayati]
MAIRSRINVGFQLRNICRFYSNDRKSMSTAAVEEHDEDLEESDSSNLNWVQKLDQHPVLRRREVYQEFLPDPNPFHRNKIREKLERKDMLARRSQIAIPEFYVGSIVAVTHSDPHAPGKTNRFLGICIRRHGAGLRNAFILRNVIDHLGVEVEFDTYDPTLQRIDVIRLEKRLDNELFYLRDCPPEYSTFPLDMEPEFHPEGEPVPINTIKVPLKPLPWLVKWERMNMKGLIDPLSMVNEKRKKKAALKIHTKPWEEFDLMKQYRATIPLEEQIEIFSQIEQKLVDLEIQQRRMKRAKAFVKPKKSG